MRTKIDQSPSSIRSRASSFQEHRSKQSLRTIFQQSSGRGSSIIPWLRYHPECERRGVITSYRKPASKSMGPSGSTRCKLPEVGTMGFKCLWPRSSLALLPPDSTHTKKRQDRLALNSICARARDPFGEIAMSPRNLTLPKKSKVMAHRMLNNVSKGITAFVEPLIVASLHTDPPA